MQNSLKQIELEFTKCLLSHFYKLQTNFPNFPIILDFQVSGSDNLSTLSPPSRFHSDSHDFDYKYTHVLQTLTIYCLVEV